MLIESNKEYIASLINLWHEVFGDDEDYIRLFFKQTYFDSECFAEIVDGEIVSAFYLLKCCIKFEGKIYSGRYLYAAATLPQHRGKGYMSKLIDEALSFAKKDGLDFIALVPASDSLYGYYSKFGFTDSMYKYKLKTGKEQSSLRLFREITDPCEFIKIRNSADCDMLIYNNIVTEYAFECLMFSDKKVCAVSVDSYYIEDEEFFLAKGEFSDSTDTFISSLGGEVTVYCNRELKSSEKIRNGMIHSFCDEFNPKDIYMNIALD